MIAAHMDEIGLFVSHIEDDDFLRVLPISDMPERALLFQRVVLRMRDGRVIRGVIGVNLPSIWAIKRIKARKVGTPSTIAGIVSDPSTRLLRCGGGPAGI